MVKSDLDSSPVRVIKCESNTFTLSCGGETFSAVARKKFKAGGGIVVGDFVRVENEDGSTVITDVCERKNFLIRPQAANIDQVVIFVASVPKPDFLLIDKLIINAHRQGIDTVVCLNKSDLPSSLFEDLQNQYAGVADRIISVSAKNNDLEPLRAVLRGKLSCFAGQSAVGKSSVINALAGKEIRAVGNLSEKVMRGKNTTTKAEILTIDNNLYIIDTPGFSMLDIFDIKPNELCLYYSEYVEIADKCKYRNCTHTLESECEVARRVESGELNMHRFMRYVQLCAELEEKNKHGRRKYK